MKSVEVKPARNAFPVAEGIWGGKSMFVNFYMIQDKATASWVLVDAGLKWSALHIKDMAAELFGSESRPDAIILTHGHFDHVGALRTLLNAWDVPVYAHELELPYLTGKSAYPPADPSVGGGMMSEMSFMYPTGPIDISGRVQKLPADGSVPRLPDWRYIETPGHSPGHISLFREYDRVLIAGDAFVTTRAESAFCALTAKEHLSGPPKYFTCDWATAKFSLYKLVELHAEIVATGHGKPMRGEEMRRDLESLAVHFNELAQPARGRYVDEPAITNQYGVAAIPARVERIPRAVKIGIGALVVTIAVLMYLKITEDEQHKQ